LVKKFKSEGGDTLKALVGSSQGTYNFNDLVDEMRQGTKKGQKLYTTLYPLYEKEFKEHLDKNSEVEEE
jgi:hypothetical protein